MLKPLKLLLPALLPSWNFFDIIAPSPRIQYALLESPDACAEQWQEFRPRPAHLSLAAMLGRLLWNPRWNESLFMMSCAERIYEHYTPHSETEILQRIRAELLRDKVNPLPPDASSYLQFRLVFISRANNRWIEHIEYESRIVPLAPQVSA
jgi:hypothetical protein